MARINIVIPPLDQNRFSGGIICILEYARGLRARGHLVNLIPLLPSSRPLWARGDIGVIPELDLPSTISHGIRAESLYSLPIEMLAGVFLIYARELLTQEHLKADITLATAALTALPAKLYGTGRCLYFAQHFEPYFGPEVGGSISWWEHQALESYHLGLEIITNSSWLAKKLRLEADVGSSLCPNAIDHSTFFGLPKTGVTSSEVRLISYGGRLAEWKGFRDMAAAVRMARQQLPGINIRWQVYGTSLLPADNSIAPYEDLGFLNPVDLAEAYRNADILLSASWYESFPLFPLEAMACGLPVITTQYGTEEYARHGVTAEIVVPQDVNNIADAIVRLITNSSFRDALAVRGNEAAKQFTWDASVTRMEQILLGLDELKTTGATSRS